MPVQKAAGTRTRLKSALLLSLLAPLSGAALGQAPPAVAQSDAAPTSAPREFRVQAGSLASVLASFARQAGVSLTFDPALARGRNSPGLAGRYALPEAFRRVLEGSGLEAMARVEGGYTLRATSETEVRAGGSANSTPPVAVVARPPASAPPAAAVELPAVVVTAEREAQPAAGTGTRNTITREQIERIPPTSTGDIFKETPGVVASNNRNGPSIQPSIRGATGLGRVKVLVDGTQASSNSFKGYGGNRDHNYVDPLLISEAIIEKGVSTGVSGGGATGGVVHLTTIGADDVLRDGRNFGLRLRGSMGNSTSGGMRDVGYGLMDGSITPAGRESLPTSNHSFSAAVAGRIHEGVELVAAMAQRRSGNYYAGSRGRMQAPSITNPGQIEDLSVIAPGAEVVNTSQSSDSYLLKARLRLPTDQSLEISYVAYESRFGENTGAVNSYSFRHQQPLKSVDKTTWVAHYRWAPPGSALWNLQARVWHADLSEDRDMGDDNHHTRSSGVEVWNQSILRLADVDAHVTYGASWMKDRTGLPGDMYFEPGGEREMSGFFGQADIFVTSWLTLHGGLRRDRYEVSGTGVYASPIVGQQDVPFSIRKGEGQTTKSFGFTLEPLNGLQGFARYSDGWRLPTVREVVRGYERERVNATSTDPYMRRPLEPEQSKGLEYGLRYTHSDLAVSGDRLSVGYTLFDNKTHGYVVRPPSGGEYNFADAHFKGSEMSLNYVSRRWFGRLAMTHYDKAEYARYDGNPVVDPTSTSGDFLALRGYYLPSKRSASANVGIYLLGGRATLGWRVTYAHSQATAAARGSWDSYTVHDLFGSYRVSDDLSLSFSIENLRDRFYIDNGTGEGLRYPSPGRMARVSLNYQF